LGIIQASLKKKLSQHQKYQHINSTWSCQ